MWIFAGPQQTWPYSSGDDHLNLLLRPLLHLHLVHHFHELGVCRLLDKGAAADVTVSPRRRGVEPLQHIYPT
jgi:hypothetical protein